MILFQSYVIYLVIYLVLAPPFESIEREGALERHSIISDEKDCNFVAYQVLIRFTSTRALQIMESWNAGLENMEKVWRTLSPSSRLGRCFSFNSQTFSNKTFMSKRFLVSSLYFLKIKQSDCVLQFGLAYWKAFDSFRHYIV